MDDQTPTQDPQEEPVSTTNSVDMLLNMENMIKSHLSEIGTLEIELDKNKGLLDSIFKNDETFQKHDTAAKEAGRIKTATKQQILKQPQAAELNDKVKSYKSQIAELQDALSDYLREYQRMSGIDTIEDNDGEVRRIVYVAKLVKNSSYNP